MDISTSGFVAQEDFTVSNVFTELSEIYSGSYCVVYKAKKYGQWYVLKCLKDEYRHSLLYCELLKKEFDISISLNHPNIVRTIGWENIPSVGYCVVMEYIDGMSLEEYLKEKHSAKEKARVIKGIISAMAYIHGKQIVHRDLKPANIMVTANGGNAKVLDFGLSDTDSYCVLKHPAGTENYISPEQLTESVPDCRNDIYSLGCIIRKADINLYYKFLAYKCTLSKSRRFANAEIISSYISNWERFLSVIPSLVLFIVSVVFIALYTIDNKDEKRRDALLHEAIETGKHKVEKIYRPLIEFIGGREKISYKEYENLSRLISDISTEVELMCDSLVNGMDEVSKSTVTNAVYLYSSDLFKDIVLPEPVIDN